MSLRATNLIGFGVGGGTSLFRLSNSTGTNSADLSGTLPGGHTVYGLRWGDSGDALFVMQTAGSDVYRFSASTAYDLSALVFDGSFISGNNTYRGLALKNDGTLARIFDDSANTMREYALSPAWYDDTWANTSNPGINTYAGPYYNQDQTFVAHWSQTEISYRDGIPAFSFPTAGYSTQDFGGISDCDAGILLSPDEMNVYVQNGLDIERYELSSARDLSSYTDPSDSVTIGGFTAFDIHPDGSKIYYVIGQTVYEQTLGA